MNTRKPSYVLTALALASAVSVLLPCCRADMTESTSDTHPEDARESVGNAQEADTDCSHSACDNCVKHARCLQSALPYNLFTCDDKRGTINSYSPTVGAVAIMDVGPYCHVGYVYEIQGSGDSAVIGLDEANYHAGVCAPRHGTAQELKILGYFKP